MFIFIFKATRYGRQTGKLQTLPLKLGIIKNESYFRFFLLTSVKNF